MIVILVSKIMDLFKMIKILLGVLWLVGIVNELIKKKPSFKDYGPAQED